MYSVKVVIDFKTDNAAFEDDFSAESRDVINKARAFAMLAIEEKALKYANNDKKKRAESVLFDSNGNSVGEVVVAFD